MHEALPKVYAKASTGKIKEWSIKVVKNSDTSYGTEITYGYIDGDKTTTFRKVTQKNVGKSNETSLEEQAYLEANSKLREKIEKEGYVHNIEELNNTREVLRPMLAQKYNDYKHYIKFPCYIQPKLNGVRCTYQNNKFYSRNNKEYTTLNHLIEPLKQLGLPNPDGEIYTHGMNFQEIVRLVKKDRGNENKELQYWIYDQVLPDVNFETRNLNIQNAFVKISKLLNCKLVYVETKQVTSEAQINFFHNEYVLNGFEGIMIRNSDGKYLADHRSKDLQKYKEFIDTEFEIVGFNQGEGTEEGCILFICKTENETLFTVRPRGTREMRQNMFIHGNEYIGKYLTVRYQNLSEDKIPIFPVGIIVRDFE